MTVLIDTSVLLAYAFKRDINHPRAVQFVRDLSKEKHIVAAPVIVELFYRTMVRVNYLRAVQVFTGTRAAFHIEGLTDADMDRMQQIMNDYQSSQFDFTDVAVMALTERLNITQVGTFDRRDFSIFRPSHCGYLELLP